MQIDRYLDAGVWIPRNSLASHLKTTVSTEAVAWSGKSDAKNRVTPETIDSWRCLDRYSFLVCPVINIISATGQKERVLLSDIFYCPRCDSWYSTSGTISNFENHIAGPHKSLSTRQKRKSSKIDRKTNENALKRAILVHGLSFSFADLPEIHEIADMNRKDLTEEAFEIQKAVASKLRAKIQQMEHATLIVDEWEDDDQTNFLGIAIVGIVRGEFTLLILHLAPINGDASAASLSKIVQETITEFALEHVIKGILTDTTNKNPCLARLMHLAWDPCWGHCYNLMIGDLLKIFPNLRCQITEIASLVRGRKEFANLLGLQKVSIPTYSEVRWWSLLDLVSTLLKYKDAVNVFINKHNTTCEQSYENEMASYARKVSHAQAVGFQICFIQEPKKPIYLPVIAGPFEVLLKNTEEWLRVVKLSILLIESNMFGTRSLVIPTYKCILQKAEIFKSKELINAIKGRWKEYFGNAAKYPQREKLLIATRLNPVTTDLLSEKKKMEADGLIKARLATMPDRATVSLPILSQPSEEDRSRADEIHGIEILEELVHSQRPTPAARARSELDEYLKFAHDIVPPNAKLTTNILPMLLTGSMAHANVVSLAIEYNIVPATSTFVERLFSRAKHVLPLERVVAMNNDTKEMTVLLAANPEITSEVMRERQS